jgi:hypothetical protein
MPDFPVLHIPIKEQSRKLAGMRVKASIFEGNFHGFG